MQHSDDSHDAPAAGLSSSDRAALAREFTETLALLDARGLHAEAETLAQQMVQLLPDDGLGWKTLAYAHLRRGDLLTALEPLRAAAALLPDDAELQRHHLAAAALREGLALDGAGRYVEAAQRYEFVLATYPQHPDANHRLGVIAIRLGKPETALPLLEAAIGVNPNNGQYWANYVDALLNANQLKAAWIALELGQQHGMHGPGVDHLITMMSAMSSGALTVRQAPETPAAPPQATQGAAPVLLARPAGPAAVPRQTEVDPLVTLFNTRQFGKAERAARAFIEKYPDHMAGWKILCVALFEQGRYEESFTCGTRARELAPRDVPVLQALAVMFNAKLQYDASEKACRELLQAAPEHVEGVRLLAIALLGQGRYEEAEQVFLRAAELAPQTSSVRAGLGTLYLQWGRLVDATAQFRRALELSPDSPMDWSNLLFCLTHNEEVTPDEVFAEHSRFGQRFDAACERYRLPHTNTRDPERPLRIGFVSPDFRRHAVASFFEPVLVHLARAPGLLLYAYSNLASGDFVTERMRGQFAGWRDIFKVDDEEVARQIRADGIDVLIDLAGHTAENRLALFAHKPAPLQASWIGYPGTTGLKSVDYFLADRYWVPDDHYRGLFTEQIAYLPAVAPFLREPVSPPVNQLPALSKGYVTFGSFNRLDKIRRDVVALWARLMHAVPGSRLQIGAMPADGSGQAKLVEWFGAEGIDAARIDFRRRSAVPAFLQQHHAIDFCLDTFPFGGLTTALHSLCMGVPTLTLPGRTVPGRSGATAMSHAGLTQFIATDADDFVRRGAALAADLPALAALRTGMRERCDASPMFRPDAIAHGVVDALRTMWRRWCEGLPAETFSVAEDAAPARDAESARPEPQRENQLLALYNTGRIEEAETAARQLAQDFPHHMLGWKMLGLAQYRLRRHSDEVLGHLQRARALAPDDADVLQVLAALLETKGHHAEAEEAARRLVALAPAHAEAHRLHGIALMSLWRYEEAERACVRAVELAPGAVLGHNTLGLLYMRLGRLAEAAAEYRRAIAIDPGGDALWSNLMHCLQHDEAVGPAELFAEHRRFAAHFETPLKARWPVHANSRDAERVLRVGFISGDLCRHPVANFVEPLLAPLARDTGLSLYAYSNTPRPDDVTARLRGHFAHWRDVRDRHDDDIAQLVRADGIDILIDLAGHTAHSRLLVLARKPAPVQASWIGYPGTTGLDAVDYFIADRFWVPDDAAFRAQFSEQIAWLPTFAPFRAEPGAPAINALPALANGYVTFGSFNRINKLRPAVVKLWARLLHAVPNARLQIGAIPNTGDTADVLAARFAAEGIARERLTFCERGSVHAFLRQHHAVDICLDTLPFSGLTTGLQSLWMGVPTLTLPGATVPGRSGATAMSHAGLAQFVATGADDFVRRGAALAADLPALAALRAGLRERCAASPMFQPDTVARHASAALRTMWRHWCAGQPAVSFDVETASDTAEASL